LRHAREDIARIEKERAEFIHRHFRTTPDDPLRYDLIISTAMFSPDQTVDLILDARKRAGLGQ
jgi:cytidylate kinase